MLSEWNCFDVLFEVWYRSTWRMQHAMFITRERYSPPIAGYHICCVHDELHGVVGVEKYHCFGMVGACMITFDQLATL